MTSNNTTAVTIQTVRELWDGDQIALIRDTIAPGISPSELGLFAMVCKRTGLDPFAKQIYAIKRKDRMTIQTGIDGYRLLAARTGELAGIDDAVYDDEDAEHPNRASVTVWRLVQGQRVAFTATARWAEYAQYDREGNPTSMWKKMPYLMLGKCAESLALRKSFPAELSGIYTAEEMAQADNDALPTTRMVEANPQPVHTTVDEQRKSFRTATPEQWKALRDLCAKIEMPEPEPPLTYEQAAAMIAELSETHKSMVAQRQKAGAR